MARVLELWLCKGMTMFSWNGLAQSTTLKPDDILAIVTSVLGNPHWEMCYADGTPHGDYVAPRQLALAIMNLLTKEKLGDVENDISQASVTEAFNENNKRMRAA